ncbi:MAG: hypothetical protein D6776_06335 [Planctomycetota bacterium]|nr:MAG: hypothetical protein D6776_06335 [Planctomycetota bacterium]
MTSGTLELLGPSNSAFTAPASLTGGTLFVDTTAEFSASGNTWDRTYVGSKNTTGPGTVRLLNGADMRLLGSVGRTLDNVRFEIANGASVIHEQRHTTLRGGAQIINAGTYTLASPDLYAMRRIGNPGGSFSNEGQFIKTSPGENNVNVRFDSVGGTTSINNGTLFLSNGGQHTSATFTGQTLKLGGTHSFDALSKLDLATLVVTGNTTVGTGDLSLSNGLQVNSATLELAVAPLSLGNDVQLTGGTLRYIDTTAPLTLPRLTMSGGYLSTDGTVQLGSTGNLWTGGRLLGTGRLEVTSGVDLTVDLTGSYTYLRGPDLAIAPGGRLEWRAGDLLLNGASDIINDGTWSIAPAAAVRVGSFQSAGGVVNRGELRKSAAGTATVELPFDNPGTVSVLQGTFELRQSIAQLSATGDTLTGGTWLVDGGTLSFGSNRVGTIGAIGPDAVVRLGTGGQFTALSTTSLSNYGTIGGDGGHYIGTVLNHGVLDPGASPGTTTFDSLVQDAAGLLRVEIGGYARGTDYDWVHVLGSATLAGSVELVMWNGFAPEIGDSFTILTADAGISGSFDTLIAPDPLWHLVYRNNAVLAVYAPEPDAALLAFAAALLLALRYGRGRA